jgi:hypothetical protein
VAPKSAVAAPASSDLSGASRAKVAADGPAPDKALLANQTAKAVAKTHLATLAANKQLAAKQAAKAAAGAEEAKEQNSGTEEPGETLGTQFSAKA